MRSHCQWFVVRNQESGCHATVSLLIVVNMELSAVPDPENREFSRFSGFLKKHPENVPKFGKK